MRPIHGSCVSDERYLLLTLSCDEINLQLIVSFRCRVMSGGVTSYFCKYYPLNKFRRAYSSIEAGIANSTTATVSDSSSGSSGSGRVLEAGEVAGDYSRDWKGKPRLFFSFNIFLSQLSWSICSLSPVSTKNLNNKPTLLNPTHYPLQQNRYIFSSIIHLCALFPFNKAQGTISPIPESQQLKEHDFLLEVDRCKDHGGLIQDILSGIDVHSHAHVYIHMVGLKGGCNNIWADDWWLLHPALNGDVNMIYRC